MICDTLEHLARYKGLHPNLDTAIDYLLTHDLSALPNGRTEVDGDEVFINVMDAALHPDAGYHPEYHKLYADLQIDITGGEGWGYTNEPGEEVGEYTVDCGFQDSASVVSGALGRGAVRPVLPHGAAQTRPGTGWLCQCAQGRCQNQNGGLKQWIRKNCLLRSRAV